MLSVEGMEWFIEVKSSRSEDGQKVKSRDLFWYYWESDLVSMESIQSIGKVLKYVPRPFVNWV